MNYKAKQEAETCGLWGHLLVLNTEAGVVVLVMLKSEFQP